MPSPAIRPGDVEVDAVAGMLVVDGEDLLADILLIAPCLVCSVHTLERVVADEVLLHEDRFSFELSVPRPADHLLLTSRVSTFPLVGRLDQMTPVAARVISIPALARRLASAPVEQPQTGFVLPIRLVGAEDRVR